MTPTTQQEALTAARLRDACVNIRRKPFPIADLIPLLQQAADALESRTPPTPPEGAADREALRAALAELVAVEEIRYNLRSGQPEQVYAECRARQDAAWAAAASPRETPAGLTDARILEIRSRHPTAIVLDGEVLNFASDIIAALASLPKALPPQPEPPNTAYAITLLTAAAKSGDPGAMSLAAQLAGVSPCPACGFVKQHFRDELAAQPPTPPSEGET